MYCDTVYCHDTVHSTYCGTVYCSVIHYTHNIYVRQSGQTLPKNPTGYVRSPPYPPFFDDVGPLQAHCLPMAHPIPDETIQLVMMTCQMSLGTKEQPNPNENAQEMTSKVLKFSFVYSDKKPNSIQPHIIHTHWMQIVQETLGDEIIIINNHNKHVEQVSTLKWTDPTIHQKQFNMHSKTSGQGERRQTTYFILHKIRTDKTVSSIKNITAVKQLLKKCNTYITDHQWTETQWETNRIGFVTKYDPSFFNCT